jgi:DNA repair protein RecO
VTGVRSRSAPSRVVSDRALLLARTPYGESSLVVHLLTAQHGPVRLLAKGAYRATSRFAYVLDLFHTLELEWRAPAGDGLALLVSGDLLVRRAGVVRLGAAYRAAACVLETARLVAREGVREARLFATCGVALDRLESAARCADEAAARRARVAFDLAALHNLGLAPALLHCASCGRRAPAAASAAESTVFAVAYGGRLCRACATRTRREADGATALTRTRARLLEQAAALVDGLEAPLLEARGDAEADAPLDAAAAGALGELERLVDRFTNHHLERERRSLAPTR